MDFDYLLESIKTDSLQLSYFLVPWDTAILGRPVAEISHFELTNPRKADHDYETFLRWCKEQKIFLSSCRVGHDKIKESLFLQERGFRLVELNYRPRPTGLQNMEIQKSELSIEEAGQQDREYLAKMAGEIFQYGRLHQDPRLGRTLGDRRYRMWIENSFSRPQQKILKCIQCDEIAGILVVEYPEPQHCFWSLAGMAPGLLGKALGKKVFRAMLWWHQVEGIDKITTSVSSHNVVALNLYISLGFRFPQPLITLHWHPLDALYAE